MKSLRVRVRARVRARARLKATGTAVWGVWDTYYFVYSGRLERNNYRAPRTLACTYDVLFFFFVFNGFAIDFIPSFCKTGIEWNVIDGLQCCVTFFFL